MPVRIPVGEFQVTFVCTVKTLYCCLWFLFFWFFAKPAFSSQLLFLLICSCFTDYPSSLLECHFYTSFSYTNQKQTKWERNYSTGMRSGAVNDMLNKSGIQCKRHWACLHMLHLLSVGHSSALCCGQLWPSSSTALQQACEQWTAPLLPLLSLSSTKQITHHGVVMNWSPAAWKQKLD